MRRRYDNATETSTPNVWYDHNGGSTISRADGGYNNATDKAASAIHDFIYKTAFEQYQKTDIGERAALAEVAHYAERAESELKEAKAKVAAAEANVAEYKKAIKNKTKLCRYDFRHGSDICIRPKHDDTTNHRSNR